MQASAHDHIASAMFPRRSLSASNIAQGHDPQALFNAGTIGEVWMPSMSQSQDAAASNAAEQLEPVSIAEPVQLGTTDVLPCQQQHQKQQQGPSLFRSQQAAAVPVDSASEQACESGQHASVPANDIASVFDFL